MATVNLGRIGFINKGVYASDVTYDKLDVVNYNNGIYSALKTVKGVTPTDDGVNWRRMIDAGSAIGNAITAADNANTAAERANIAAARAEKYSDEYSEIKQDLNRIGTTLSNYETVAFTLENMYINEIGAYSSRNGAGITDFIPITKGIDILYRVMSGQAASSVAYYGSTELSSFISVETPAVYEMHQGVVSHSVYGANYCRISTFVNDGNSYVKVGYSFNYVTNNDRLNALESGAQLFDSIQKPFDFNNKRITAFGDSITYGVTSPNLVKGTPYIELFANKVGASNLLNLAVSGSCIADPTNPNSIYSKIKAFTTLSVFIVVSGGTNDFNTSKELGTYGSTDTSTFYGALNDICKYFYTDYNLSTIIFITPIPYTEAYYVNHPRKNALGYELNDYRRAIFEVATAYGFNVVNGADLGMPTGKGGWDNIMCDDSDGCHPTQRGHELYARALCGKLL